MQEPVPLVTIVVHPQGEGSEPRSVQVDSSKFGFLSVQVQDEAYAQQYVNTSEVIADLSEAAVGLELATDIAVTLDVADGRTAVSTVRIAAQVLRGADYLQLLEALYLEKVVTFLRLRTTEAEESEGQPQPTTKEDEKEVVTCVHTGQLMWDHLGAYAVLRLEQLGVISLGHKGFVVASDLRIDDKLLSLANTMNDVTSLDISKNIHITNCNCFAETLVKLEVRSCTLFVETSLEAVARHGQLQHLGVGGTVGVITDASISLVARHCKHLKYLDVSGTSRMITDTSIQSIAENCPELQHLDVSGTLGAFTDNAILTVARHCTQLVHLDVGDTHGKITDTSISAIAENCVNLQYLDVKTNSQITDASILTVAEHCSQLKYLDVSYSFGLITDKSISVIAKRCTQLEFLDVTSSAVTEECLCTSTLKECLCLSTFQNVDIDY